jgi:hypothetical protein
MKYYCNPLNLEYRYQFIRGFGVNAPKDGYAIFREAADPSIVLFKGLYYMFASVSAGFFSSGDLVDWTFHAYLSDMPMYDYAPDVRVIGGYLYFSASKRDEICSFYRTKDPIHEPFEEIPGTFAFWDPNLFEDEDGRLYFYWGCSNMTPIYGVELDPAAMKPLTEPIVLFDSDDAQAGYERAGEDHSAVKVSDAEINARITAVLAGVTTEQKARFGGDETTMRAGLYALMCGRPYIEGAWMTKHRGKYYLQYASPGTEYNTYNDSVYIGGSPLGPFTRAPYNPVSYKPGGFVTGAGHGSTLEDKNGHYWHGASLRISRGHPFERRLGLWKSGFDADGVMFCDQRFGDWPVNIDAPAFADPEWVMLSYNKPAQCSSGTGGQNVCNEDVRTWWRAETNKPGEWVSLDLGQVQDLRAIQLNFADENINAPLPSNAVLKEITFTERYIDTNRRYTRWLLEGSIDGGAWFTITDKRCAETDLPHDFLVYEGGVQTRYVRLTVFELPYNAVPCVSGLRVFGMPNGAPPEKAKGVKAAILANGLDMDVSWQSDAVGAVVLWGAAADKLYHSYMVYGKTQARIGALIKDAPVYVRVDAFGEGGAAHGDVTAVSDKRGRE